MVGIVPCRRRTRADVRVQVPDRSAVRQAAALRVRGRGWLVGRARGGRRSERRGPDGSTVPVRAGREPAGRRGADRRNVRGRRFRRVQSMYPALCSRASRHLPTRSQTPERRPMGGRKTPGSDRSRSRAGDRGERSLSGGRSRGGLVSGTGDLLGRFLRRDCSVGDADPAAVRRRLSGPLSALRDGARKQPGIGADGDGLRVCRRADRVAVRRVGGLEGKVRVGVRTEQREGVREDPGDARLGLRESKLTSAG